MGDEVFWRQLRRELSNARDATVLLAAIAGFLAWIIQNYLGPFLARFRSSHALCHDPPLLELRRPRYRSGGGGAPAT